MRGPRRTDSHTEQRPSKHNDCQNTADNEHPDDDERRNRSHGHGSPPLLREPVYSHVDRIRRCKRISARHDEQNGVSRSTTCATHRREGTAALTCNSLNRHASIDRFPAACRRTAREAAVSVAAVEIHENDLLQFHGEALTHENRNLAALGPLGQAL